MSMQPMSKAVSRRSCLMNACIQESRNGCGKPFCEWHDEGTEFPNRSLRIDGHLNKDFWCRCARGKHPYPSRTRWLSPGRPMILRWGRRGKAGGCQILWGYSSAGRAPALQAGGHEFDPRYLHRYQRYRNNYIWAYSSAG